MNETIQQVASILKSGEVVSSARAFELVIETSNRLSEVQVRIDLIKPQSATESAGPERRKLLIVGSDTRALDAEWEQLRMDAETLKAQREEMTRLRVQARNREASEGLPDLVKTMGKQVSEVEAALAAVGAARARLRETHDRVTQDRGTARNAGLPCASVSPAVIDRLLAVDPSYERYREATRERLGDSRLHAGMGFAA